mmetsp:Transcript_4776/g.9577  ORF Transcript_4776/g.9577 Transcript_4776/m.9577 type:complete len:238 (-) Transcript_4776:2-715(-)
MRVFLIYLFSGVLFCDAYNFVLSYPRIRSCLYSKSNADSDADSLLVEAKRLREEAAELQESIGVLDVTEDSTDSMDSMESAESLNSMLFTHRLFLNFGREENTWMEPSWGRSGRRIEATLDVAFQEGSTITASAIRLRGGFDSLPVRNAKYEITNKGTIVFTIDTNGTEEGYDSQGDIYIPKGEFLAKVGWLGGTPNSNPNNFSNREGVLTVRQRGWHTGLPRMESRIAGVVRVDEI